MRERESEIHINHSYSIKRVLFWTAKIDKCVYVNQNLERSKIPFVVNKEDFIESAGKGDRAKKEEEK